MSPDDAGRVRRAPTSGPTFDTCFTPELLPLYDLRGRVAVVVDVLRATSSIVTALAQDVTHLVPVSEVAECRALAAEGYLTAAERDGRQAEGVDLGNSPFGYLDGAVPVRGRAVAITTTNGTRALHLSAAADAVLVGAFLNLGAVAARLRQLNQDVVVVCAGWKGKFCLEDTLFAGALAQRLADAFDPSASDATLAALDLWHAARPDVAGYLLKSSHVRRLNSLEAHKDMAFCVREDEYDLVPVFRAGKIEVL
ncbi:2-phosphosulfolactate phosphatase [Hymenobacter weizhouensis]|uniref:2-phosphosulfolactate phosphatase n=1 Tax=Hymenobacter sp. YIM 151500-1 TaxID=2987689 RepID=UPI0022264D27|nr:2-phosphosulfolactate phosphatase [Hymenobacter sp. YIM 151500-1]UYZ63287.1 2-phosphosulfolactate phosphatase [Hymenobacter sp. YIM 151500-1]